MERVKSATPSARRTRRLTRTGGRSGNALVGNAAADRTHRLGEPVQHGLGAQLVVQGVAVNAELPRSLSDVALARGHGRHDVLALKGLDRLLECDSVADQFTNDGVQAIVDAYHFDLDLSGGVGRIGILLLKIRVTGRKIFLSCEA